MGLPPCLAHADLYPRVKAEAARALIAQGWNQPQTATALHVSQAMVSKYASKEADPEPTVQVLARQVLAHIESGDSQWCETVARQETDKPHWNDFQAAEKALLEKNPNVMPQVGFNLVLLVGDQVLGYPGRIIQSKGKWIKTVPAELGVNGHLAARLRALHKANPRIRALANIRGDAHLATQLGGHCKTIHGNGQFDQTLDPNTDTIYDAGDFGIEPCIYVGGDTAQQVAHRILQVQP